MQSNTDMVSILEDLEMTRKELVRYGNASLATLPWPYGYLWVPSKILRWMGLRSFLNLRERCLALKRAEHEVQTLIKRAQGSDVFDDIFDNILDIWSARISLEALIREISRPKDISEILQNEVTEEEVFSKIQADPEILRSASAAFQGCPIALDTLCLRWHEPLERQRVCLQQLEAELKRLKGL